MTGWRCPGCSACYAPHVSECSRCRGAMVTGPFYPQPRPIGPYWPGYGVTYTTGTRTDTPGRTHVCSGASDVTTTTFTVGHGI